MFSANSQRIRINFKHLTHFRDRVEFRIDASLLLEHCLFTQVQLTFLIQLAIGQPSLIRNLDLMNFKET